jgi:hypothetical protein
MCPFCLATAAVIAGSATGTGGVTALVAGIFLKRNKRKVLPQTEAKEVEDGNDNNSGSSAEGGLSR